jgi:hypothetical protein
LKGHKAGDKTFKTHLDGYNFMPFFKGEVAAGPRHEFFYFGPTADLMALRYDDWKVSFKTIKGNLFNGSVETTQAPIRAILGRHAHYYWEPIHQDNPRVLTTREARVKPACQPVPCPDSGRGDCHSPIISSSDSP